MVFNSVVFLIFFPLVYVVYWFVLGKRLKLQNFFILAASYFFYGWWDWRFLFLLMLSTCIDYVFGILIYESQIRKKLYLWLSVLNNLVVLGFFKYYNFFADSFRTLFEQLGYSPHPYILDVALPVGISFYTFHGMSYVFDIYRNKFIPVRNFIDYSVFVSFFPLLVSGPIERATHLLPQIVIKREFNYQQSVEGMRLILWGFFKKVVVADNCASIVNQIYNSPHDHNGATFIVASIYFAFQIYGDFSGYTDIAIGTAKLLGFELFTNFKYPYFSRDIAEFWRRWHISLSSWFRDYLYIPIGGSRSTFIKAVRNVFIIFLISGFWHGANYTFIVWGGLHAAFFIPLFIFEKNRKHVKEVVAQDSLLPNLKEVFQMITTFILVTISWVFFRADNIGTALYILKKIVLESDSLPVLYGLKAFPFVVIMFVLEWFSRRYQCGIEILSEIKNPAIRYTMYSVIAFCILYFGGTAQNFIYFQF